MPKNRIIFIAATFILIGGLSACGFKPVYAKHSDSPLSKIFVQEIPTYEGQILRNELQDMFAATGNDYNLEIVINKERRNFGIQEDFRVSRYDIALTANYKLTDNNTGNVILNDQRTVYSSFNRTDSEFSTFVAEEDATKLAAEDMAFEIRSTLAAHFSR